MVRVRGALGEATFKAARGRGAAMALHEVTNYAIDQVRFALTALGTA